jgi:hypothetical protein
MLARRALAHRLVAATARTERTIWTCYARLGRATNYATQCLLARRRCLNARRAGVPHRQCKHRRLPSRRLPSSSLLHRRRPLRRYRLRLLHIRWTNRRQLRPRSRQNSGGRTGNAARWLVLLPAEARCHPVYRMICGVCAPPRQCDAFWWTLCPRFSF